MCVNSEHLSAGEPPLEVGDWLSARKSRSWETKPHKTRPRVADKFTDLGHGYYKATGILEEIQREFPCKKGCVYVDGGDYNNNNIYCGLKIHWALEHQTLSGPL